jgi:hypothetical protein
MIRLEILLLVAQNICIQFFVFGNKKLRRCNKNFHKLIYYITGLTKQG